MIISGQLTQDMIPDMELGTTHYALSVSIYQNLLKGRWLQNQNKNVGWHWIWVRENGGSLDFNFISLPNPAVDENWVCWHHLKQFIPGKWCHIQWFDLFKLFVNGILPEHFHFFLCVYGYTLFLSAHFIDRQLHSSYSTILALCALGDAVCIFHTSDAE